MHTYKILLAVLLFTCSTCGYSIFDFQLLGGKRAASLKTTTGSSTVNGTEYKAAAHLDPIPLVPIAFGLAATSVTFKNAKGNLNFDEFKGNEYSFEVMAWIPKMVISLEPYVKVGYTLTGSYNLTSSEGIVLGASNNTEVKYKPSGLDMALGITYSPLPLIGFILEVDKRMETLKFDSATIGGIAITSGNDLKNDSLSYLVGLEIGL